MISGDSTKNENSYASCSGLKKAGHFKSEIYNLKNPDDKWSRIAFCDMQNSDGYDDNSIESLLGYVNTSPEPTQIMFSVYSHARGYTDAGTYISFDSSWINNGNHFSIHTWARGGDMGGSPPGIWTPPVYPLVKFLCPPLLKFLILSPP